MNEQNIKKMITLMNKEFKNREIYIRLTGAIETIIKMQNLKYFIDNNIILLEDKKENQFKIETSSINNVIISKNIIILEMDGYYSILLQN